MSERRETLAARALPGCEPEIGIWLWAMEEARRGLLQTVADLDQQVLDWRGPDGQGNPRHLRGRPEVTPEWAVFHLVEHEAGHLFQIRALKKQARRYLSRA